MRSPTCSTLASVAVLALGAILLMFGLHGRKTLLAANPCNMTYSNPSFVQIATNSSLTGFTLWQHTRGKNAALLPQPVLFIHGNSGRYTNNTSQGLSDMLYICNVFLLPICYLVDVCVVFVKFALLLRPCTTTTRFSTLLLAAAVAEQLYMGLR